MRRTLLLLLALIVFAGCDKAKRGGTTKPPANGGAKVKPEVVEPAVGSTAVEPEVKVPAVKPKPPSFPRRVDGPCPECSGLGRCIRCGDERPCYLCDGGGACGHCGGSGNDREGKCLSCEASGRCLDCGGNGVVSRGKGGIGPSALPGQCPLCHRGSGFCPDCGGHGKLPDKRTCSLCAGQKWCPDCRGSGNDVWCGGSGDCGS